MANVKGTVYGREYTLACDAGQERHLQQLIAQVNARTGRLESALGKMPEGLMLLYTCLMLADELHETSKEVTGLRQQAARAEQLNGAGDDARLAALEEEVAGNLVALAGRIENLAGKLEGSA